MMAETTVPAQAVGETPPPRWIQLTRRLLVGVGALVMAYAVIGALTDDRTRPIGHLLFLAAVLLAHDGLLMPAAIGAGIVIGRVVPDRVRAVVAAAGFVSLAVVVVALPLVVGLAEPDDGPSALPLNYRRGLILTLAAVWAGALVMLAYRWVVARRVGPDGRRS